MPRSSHPGAVQRFLEALDAAGYRVNRSEGLQPALLDLEDPEGPDLLLLVYHWLLHGRGPAEPLREMREPPGAAHPLLLGYEPEREVFAAWPASAPRAQLWMPEQALDVARHTGIAFLQPSAAGEIVPATFRPDAVREY